MSEVRLHVEKPRVVHLHDILQKNRPKKIPRCLVPLFANGSPKKVMTLEQIKTALGKNRLAKSEELVPDRNGHKRQDELVTVEPRPESGADPPVDP